VSSAPISAVVLAKDPRHAKTRVGLDDCERQRMALTLVSSTVETTLRTDTIGRVLVVTSSAHIASRTQAVGGIWVREFGVSGINEAAARGRRHALALAPQAPVAILVADLPMLSPRELDEAVKQFRRGMEPMYVADHHGIGTTMLIHGPWACPAIGFGPDSAAVHARHGYRGVEGDLRGLRTDLDTKDDLDLVCSAAGDRPDRASC
jgi:2-phospho-L-lactate/phosphoenolpyruvate guanylyltransferase